MGLSQEELNQEIEFARNLKESGVRVDLIKEELEKHGLTLLEQQNVVRALNQEVAHEVYKPIDDDATLIEIRGYPRWAWYVLAAIISLIIRLLVVNG